MDDSGFYDSLPYFLRSYMDGKHWTSFREIQRRSFEVLNESDNHLIISAGTSSGKTEAAFFPVISHIYKQKPKRISTLYISPLIALIDDQHDRLSRMIRDSGIELHSWHGYISSSVKNRILKNGEGILQITPESLENIVNKKYTFVAEMFSDLRFVIIDEVHTFMNSDRGLHLLCELDAIDRMAGCHPRRIGLSATLSDFDKAKEWIRSNTGKAVSLISYPNTPEYNLTIRYVQLAEKNTPERQKSLARYYESLYNDTFDYNCLVFANNRTAVENTVTGLKKIDALKGTKKEIWAHHSSISKEYREEAERHLKDPHFKCTAIATSTLELGVDIGNLDRVVQINAPYSVSSLVQKFGRSGRRDGHPVMICHCNNIRTSKLEGIATDLIKCIAESLLFLDDHWIEPMEYSGMPYSLLFQQTLGYVSSRITATREELFNDVLSLYPFRNITEEDYQILLDYMRASDILDFNHDCGSYTTGSSGDKMARQFDFCTNFETVKAYNVYSGGHRIGTVQSMPAENEFIQLAGRSWQVKSVDWKTHEIKVISASTSTETFWKSGVSDTHTEVMEKMYDCLSSDEVYPFLDQEAKDVLQSSRISFRKNSLQNKLTLYGGALCLFPWLGTIQADTLFRILDYIGLANSFHPPFFMIIKEEYGDMDIIRSKVEDFITTHDPMDLVTDDDVLHASSLGKYNRYIPNELLKKQFVTDRIDFSFIDHLRSC